MRKCPSCETAHPEGTVFCPDCGASLVSASETLGVAATGLDVATPRLAPPRSSDAPDALIGQTVGSVYRVIERIGVGGMGVVYRVEHENLGKKFALKVLGQVAEDHPDAVERFRQEAVAASRIEHDNIVDIITLDATDDGHLYIIMELLKGQSLAEAIRSGPMTPARALPIVYQICSALHAAHEAGIIHRDMKPENVFLTRKGEVEFVKILDFGISKIHDAETERVRITKTGHVLGTPLYMSPEQAKGVTDLDRRVDVYSLGVMLYEMLSGAPPFQGDNYFQLIWKHSNETPAEPKGDAPAALKQIVMKALEKEPRNRWSSMVALEEALAAAVPSVARPSFLLDARAGAATPAPAFADRGSASPARPRRTALVIAGGIGLVVVAGAITGLAMRADGEGDGRAGVLAVVQTSDSAPDSDLPPPDASVVDTVPASPAMVRLAVRTEPSGAEVFLGAERLGETPIDLEREESAGELELRIVKRGFATVTRRVTLTDDVSVDISLARARRRVEPTKGGPLPFKRDF